MVTKYLACNMAAGVPQDRVLNTPLQSTVDQTDVGMEKEERGRMTSTDCRVCFKIIMKCFSFCGTIIQNGFTGQGGECHIITLTRIL